MNNTRMYCKLLDTLRPFAFSCLETKQRQYVTLSSTVIKFHLCIVGDAVPFDNHISNVPVGTHVFQVICLLLFMTQLSSVCQRSKAACAKP